MKKFPHTQALMQQIVDEFGKDEILRQVPELSPQFLRSILAGIKAIPAPIAWKIAKEFSLHQTKFIHCYVEDCRDHYLTKVGEV